MALRAEIRVRAVSVLLFMIQPAPYLKHGMNTPANQPTIKPSIMLFESLELIKELKLNHEITFIEFYADSQLMVRQINMEYKVKDAGLLPMFKKAQSELNSLKIPHTIKHIERKLNKEADKLANMGIDNKNAL